MHKTKWIAVLLVMAVALALGACDHKPVSGPKPQEVRVFFDSEVREFSPASTSFSSIHQVLDELIKAVNVNTGVFYTDRRFRTEFGSAPRVFATYGPDVQLDTALGSVTAYRVIIVTNLMGDPLIFIQGTGDSQSFALYTTTDIAKFKKFANVVKERTGCPLMPGE
ncbi:MAG: hypothetical protein H5T64_01785 [Chloroflexi bacterium]|nr:hypothetical protein [Chloroflexota bacterium]